MSGSSRSGSIEIHSVNEVAFGSVVNAGRIAGSQRSGGPDSHALSAE